MCSEVLKSTFLSYRIDILVALVVILICFYVWERRKLYALAWKCTGPFAWPIFGNLVSFGFSPKSLATNFQKMCLKYPRVLRVWILNNLMLVLTDPEDICSALGNLKIIQRSKDHTKLFELVNKGLFTAPPEQWKVQRKILNPIFSLENMYGYLKVFNTQSEILRDQLGAKVNDGETDIYLLVGRCTADIFQENTLGRKSKMQTEEQELYDALREGNNLLFTKIIYQTFGNSLGSFIFHKTSHGEKYRKSIKRFSAIFGKSVSEKYGIYKSRILEDKMNSNEAVRDKKKKDEIEDMNNNNVVKDKNNELSILDFMLSKEKFSKEELVHQTMTLFAGGNDAVALATSYTVLMLAMHEEIQEELYCELEEIFGDSDRPVTPADLSNMKYLERVMNETLRLFPVTYHATRETTEEVKIGSLTVPPGVSLFINMVALHRDPRLWPDPLKFDPDRFLPEEIEKRHKGSWIPFSLGPRNCIGFKYGIIMMKVQLAHILRRYKFRTGIKKVEDIQLSYHLLLRNLTGFDVTIERRERRK